MNKRSSSTRAFTLAETLTVIVMITLFFGVAFAVLTPLTQASTQGQAKLETVQTATQGYYVIQRDLRESDYSQVWTCNTAASTCSSTTASTSGDPVIAIATANDSSGHITLTNGTASWKGFYVYFTSGGVLYRSYQVPAHGISQPPTADQAADAVSGATPSSPVAGDTFLVGDYSLNVAFSSPAVSLTMVARSTAGGSTNQTTYQTAVLPRN